MGRKENGGKEKVEGKWKENEKLWCLGRGKENGGRHMRGKIRWALLKNFPSRSGRKMERDESIF